jgi:Hint module
MTRCYAVIPAPTVPVPADVTPDDYCDIYKGFYCASEGCCDGKCTDKYQAYYRCFADYMVSNMDPAGECEEFDCEDPPDDGGGGGGGGGCFSATSPVQVLGQGLVQMQHLQLGDQVLTGSPDNYKYQPVYAFGHLNKEAIGTFYGIALKGGEMPLEMTGEHLVYLAGKPNPVRADSLQVGDVLVSIHGPSEITSIDVVEKKGLFHPLTADGRLVVNEIAVSTYIALQEKNPEHFQIAFDKRGYYKINLASHQTFVHLYLTPFRMLCMGMSSQLCQVLDAQGIPIYISSGMKLVHWVGEQNVLVQMVFLFVTIPIFVLLLAMEKLVGASVAPLAIFALVLVSKEVPALIWRQKPKVV